MLNELREKSKRSDGRIIGSKTKKLFADASSTRFSQWKVKRARLAEKGAILFISFPYAAFPGTPVRTEKR